MKLADSLSPAQIRVPLAAQSKPEVLRELVSLLPSATSQETRERVLESVLDRESKMSTGIGQGVAIPHGRSELVRDVEMAFGISRVPIEFDALDGRPVEVFFLIVTTPSRGGAHLQALARISRMLSSERLRDDLSCVRTAQEVLTLFRREEDGG
jgi:mannitol/fructose-specific phosphotransferase system IIA component (Ntr-type)